MSTFRLARRLRAERAVDSMSDAQMAVLGGLKVHGPATLGVLAERERVSAPSMNRTVNCLEEAGWVTRTADEADRRKVIVDLTPEGLAVVKETVRRRDAWLESALADLDAEELEILHRAAPIMQRLAER